MKNLLPRRIASLYINVSYIFFFDKRKLWGKKPLAFKKRTLKLGGRRLHFEVDKTK